MNTLICTGVLARFAEGRYKIERSRRPGWQETVRRTGTARKGRGVLPQYSLGVGYEIGLAQAMGKKVFCLYRERADRRLSAMIAGNPELTVYTYVDFPHSVEGLS